jgi:hypothetical protein
MNEASSEAGKLLHLLFLQVFKGDQASATFLKLRKRLYFLVVLRNNNQLKG